MTVSNARGYVVGMAGSRIDVSGVSGELDVLRSSDDLLTGRAPIAITRVGMAKVINPYVRQAVWSDGGVINLSGTESLFFDGALDASAGTA